MNYSARSRERGFTLVELLVVVSIVALLSSAVLASVTSAREKARIGTGLQREAMLWHMAGDALAGQWEFDECGGTIAVDGSGFSHFGTPVSSPSYSSDTPTGKGCSILLNGTTQYIDLGNGTYWDFTNALSISAWFKTTNTANQIIIGKDHTTSYYLNMANNILSFYSNGTALAAPVTPISDGRWHQVVAVFDGGAKSIYIDGQLRGTATGATMVADTKNLRIGNSGNVSNPFNGNLDSVRIYGKAMTAMEVGRAYAEVMPHVRLAAR